MNENDKKEYSTISTSVMEKYLQLQRIREMRSEEGSSVVWREVFLSIINLLKKCPMSSLIDKFEEDGMKIIEQTEEVKHMKQNNIEKNYDMSGYDMSMSEAIDNMKANEDWNARLEIEERMGDLLSAMGILRRG